MLIFDWQVGNRKAAILTAAVPALLFLLGFQQFIGIMSVGGALFGASIDIAILLMYLRAKRLGDREPAFSLWLPAAAVYTIIAAMAAAGVYQILYWVH